jgi:hypothetical protein
MIAYKNYRDIRGDAAKPLSVATGIDEPSVNCPSGYLVEIREAQDHVRLSAHAPTYFREVLIYNDRRLEDTYIDNVAEQARKTVYSPDGVITTYQAPWSVRANGYMGEYKQTEKVEGQTKLTAAEWEKYDGVLMDAEVASSKQPFAPERTRRPSGPKPSGKPFG